MCDLLCNCNDNRSRKFTQIYYALWRQSLRIFNALFCTAQLSLQPGSRPTLLCRFWNYLWTLCHLTQQTFKINEPPDLSSLPKSSCYISPCRAKHHPVFPHRLGRTCPHIVHCAWLYGEAVRNLGPYDQSQSQSVTINAAFCIILEFHSESNNMTFPRSTPPLKYLSYFVACLCVCCAETLGTEQAYLAYQIYQAYHFFEFVFTGCFVLATWFASRRELHPLRSPSFAVGSAGVPGESARSQQGLSSAAMPPNGGMFQSWVMYWSDYSVSKYV